MTFCRPCPSSTLPLAPPQRLQAGLRGQEAALSDRLREQSDRLLAGMQRRPSPGLCAGLDERSPPSRIVTRTCARKNTFASPNVTHSMQTPSEIGEPKPTHPASHASHASHLPTQHRMPPPPLYVTRPTRGGGLGTAVTATLTATDDEAARQAEAQRREAADLRRALAEAQEEGRRHVREALDSRLERRAQGVHGLA